MGCSRRRLHPCSTRALGFVLPVGVRELRVRHRSREFTCYFTIRADTETQVTVTFPDGDVRYAEYRFGGTSLSTPLLAGLTVLAVQEGGARLGLLNPALYELAGRYFDLYTRQAGLEANRFINPGEKDKEEEPAPNYAEYAEKSGPDG